MLGRPTSAREVASAASWRRVRRPRRAIRHHTRVTVEGASTPGNGAIAPQKRAALRPDAADGNHLLWKRLLRKAERIAQRDVRQLDNADSLGEPRCRNKKRLDS